MGPMETPCGSFHWNLTSTGPSVVSTKIRAEPGTVSCLTPTKSQLSTKAVCNSWIYLCGMDSLNRMINSCSSTFQPLSCFVSSIPLNYFVLINSVRQVLKCFVPVQVKLYGRSLSPLVCMVLPQFSASQIWIRIRSMMWLLYHLTAHR